MKVNLKIYKKQNEIIHKQTSKENLKRKLLKMMSFFNSCMIKNQNTTFSILAKFLREQFGNYKPLLQNLIDLNLFKRSGSYVASNISFPNLKTKAKSISMNPLYMDSLMKITLKMSNWNKNKILSRKKIRTYLVKMDKISFDRNKLWEGLNSRHKNLHLKFNNLSNLLGQNGKKVNKKLFEDMLVIRKLLEHEGLNKVELKQYKNQEREYSFLINAPKVFREALVLDDQKIIEIDVDSSQVNLLLNRYANFLDEWGTIDSDKEEIFKLLDGDFYANLQNVASTHSSLRTLDRKQFKKRFLILLYSKKIRDQDPLSQLLKKQFKLFFKWLKLEKEKFNNSELAILFQNEEAMIMNLVFREMGTIGIFDSLLVQEDKRLKAIKCLKKHWQNNLHALVKPFISFT